MIGEVSLCVSYVPMSHISTFLISFPLWQLSFISFLQLQIWDTAGMEQFRSSLITKYYRNAHGVVLVYDITNPDSFNNLEKWINEIKHYCNLESVQMVLIGNKLDQEDDRKVPTEAGQKFADRYGMPTFVEMSAMNIDNLPLLEETLTVLAQRMFDEREEKEMTLSSRGVIRLESLLDEWEIVEAPEEPIPRHTYAHQDSRARRSRAFKSCKC